MKEEKSLHFVQCGSTLLQCDSVFCYRCPPLGVSSLDLGRLFIQAALFSISITGGRPHRVNPTTVVEIVQRASSDHVSSGAEEKDLDTAKADFKAAWENLKARVSKDELAAAFKDLNIRDDG